MSLTRAQTLTKVKELLTEAHDLVEALADGDEAAAYVSDALDEVDAIIDHDGDSNADTF